MGNSLAIAGLTLLALAMVSVVFLVVDFLFGAVAATVTTLCVAAGFGGIWYVAPLSSRLRLH
jgi:hypothetical protein